MNLEHWGIKGCSNDTFSPREGEIVRIPAPPLHEHLRTQVNSLNAGAIQEFEIGVSGQYSLFFEFLSLIFTFSPIPLVSRPRARLDGRIDWCGFDCRVGPVRGHRKSLIYLLGKYLSC